MRWIGFFVVAGLIAIGCKGGIEVDVGPVDGGIDAAPVPVDATVDTGTSQLPKDSGAQDADSGDANVSDANASDAGGTCSNNTKQTEKFPTACQACLEKSCCDKLQGCFNIVKEPNKLDCNDLTKCVGDCYGDPTKSTAEKDQCADDCADPDANTQGVVNAYNNIIVCSQDNCEAECD